jgi:hypothetical protein
VIIRRRSSSWHSPEMAEESYEDLSHYSRQEVRRLNQVPRNYVPAPAFQTTEKGVNGFVKSIMLEAVIRSAGTVTYSSGQ